MPRSEVPGAIDLVATRTPKPRRIAEVVPPRSDNQQVLVCVSVHRWAQLLRACSDSLNVSPSIPERFEKLAS